MSEIKVTEAIEDVIKLQYAEEHKVAGSETWKSTEFLKFRQNQLNILNEAFTDFLNKSGNNGSRFYDAQFQNEVYQNNMNKKFRKESGLNQPLWTRIANKFNLQNKEAVGEWYEGYGDKFSRQKNDLFVKMADSIMKQAYSAAHLIEQVGARMTKYALSDNKEDLKKNPLKFVAKKLIVLPYGAVVRGGGAVLKTITNPLYPIQSIKKAWQKRNNSEKHQSMVINHQTDYKRKEVMRLNPNLSSSKRVEIDYTNNAKRKSDFKQRVAEIRQTGQRSSEKIVETNKYSALDNSQFAVALGTAYENLAYINAYSMKEDDKKAVLDEIKLVMEEAKKRYPNVGSVPEKGKYFEDKEVAGIEAQMMPYMRVAAKDNRVLAQDVQRYESWRDGKEAEIVGGGIKVTEMPFENKARYCISKDKNFTVSKDMVKNPYEAGKKTMSQQEFLQQKALVDKLTLR